MSEPPRRGVSNKYPQSMFSSKNKKNRYTPAYPKYGLREYILHGHVFLMADWYLACACCSQDDSVDLESCLWKHYTDCKTTEYLTSVGWASDSMMAPTSFRLYDP